jgi:hypothetical protein
VSPAVLVAAINAALMAAAGLALVFLALAVLPHLLLRRAQDRLAARLLASDPGGGYRLLTRAELVVGPRRRLPGVLGLTAEAIVFEGLFGERESLDLSRIAKIVTGRRLSSGRLLVRQETLRIVRTVDGGELEVVLALAAAAAWRSHLGLWAVEERKAGMDTVTPGKK